MRRPNVVRNTVPSARSLRYFPHVPFHTHTQLRVCIVTYCRKGNTQKKKGGRKIEGREREKGTFINWNIQTIVEYTHTHTIVSLLLYVCVCFFNHHQREPVDILLLYTIAELWNVISMPLIVQPLEQNLMSICLNVKKKRVWNMMPRSICRMSHAPLRERGKKKKNRWWYFFLLPMGVVVVVDKCGAAVVYTV